VPITPAQQQLLDLAVAGFNVRHPERNAELVKALETGAGPILREAAQDLQARLQDVQARLPALTAAVNDLLGALPAGVV
jgi:hypothetical protein